MTIKKPDVLCGHCGARITSLIRAVPLTHSGIVDERINVTQSELREFADRVAPNGLYSSLHPYQAKPIKALRAHVMMEKKRIVAPCGSGKKR
jgi:hypothetical protein